MDKIDCTGHRISDSRYEYDKTDTFWDHDIVIRLPVIRYSPYRYCLIFVPLAPPHYN